MTNADNPLLTPSELPYELPPFDRISDEHFLPAFEAGMAEHAAEVGGHRRQPGAADVRQHDRGAGTFGTAAGPGVVGVFQPRRVDTPTTRCGLCTRRSRRNWPSTPTPSTSTRAVRPDRAALREPGFVGPGRRSRRGCWSATTSISCAPVPRFTRPTGTAAGAERRAVVAVDTVFEQPAGRHQRAGGVVVATRPARRTVRGGDRGRGRGGQGARRHESGYLLTLSLPTAQPLLASLENRQLRERVFRARSHAATGRRQRQHRVLPDRPAAGRARRAVGLPAPRGVRDRGPDGQAPPTRRPDLLDRSAPAAVANARAEAAELPSEITRSG